MQTWNWKYISKFEEINLTRKILSLKLKYSGPPVIVKILKWTIKHFFADCFVDRMHCNQIWQQSVQNGRESDNSTSQITRIILMHQNIWI